MSVKSFSHFTYNDLAALGVQVTKEKLFSTIQVVQPTDWLKISFEIASQLPHDTEKAKSELFVAPILMEMAKINQFKFAFFSGYYLDYDKMKGLRGECDFILSKSPKVPYVDATIFTIVEAKKGDMEVGLPQLIAQMHAAALYNQKSKSPIEVIYGAVTVGTVWQFVRYEHQKAEIDTQVFYAGHQLPTLLGVLQKILNFYLD